MKDDVIKSKIKESISLYSDYSKILNENLREEIEELRRKIELTKKAMKKSGISDECRKCAEMIGSCCGRGIENRYDRVVLLINLMLGVELPDERETDGCFFLGKNGCKLVAREVLCINYLCERIMQNISRDKIIELQNIAGEEMDYFFYLINRINLILRGISDD